MQNIDGTLKKNVSKILKNQTNLKLKFLRAIFNQFRLSQSSRDEQVTRTDSFLSDLGGVVFSIRIHSVRVGISNKLLTAYLRGK